MILNFHTKVMKADNETVEKTQVIDEFVVRALEFAGFTFFAEGGTVMQKQLDEHWKAVLSLDRNDGEIRIEIWLDKIRYRTLFNGMIENVAELTTLIKMLNLDRFPNSTAHVKEKAIKV